MEQPSRDGYAVCGLGEAIVVTRSGSDRFAVAASATRALAGRTCADDPARDPRRPTAAGPVFVGGFAYAKEGGGTPEWSSLAPAALALPEVALTREGQQARLTLTLGGGPAPGHRRSPASGAPPGSPSWRPESMPLLDPDPIGRARVAGAAAPSHYEAAVARACWSGPRPASSRRSCGARSPRARRRPARPRRGARRASGRVPRLLLLVRGHARAGLRGRQPRAARAPRRRPRPDCGPGRHHPPQRRPGGGRPSRRTAPPQRQGPGRAGDRGADRSSAPSTR